MYMLPNAAPVEVYIYIIYVYIHVYYDMCWVLACKRKTQYIIIIVTSTKAIHMLSRPVLTACNINIASFEVVLKEMSSFQGHLHIMYLVHDWSVPSMDVSRIESGPSW